jgi:hypothetical protein
MSLGKYFEILVLSIHAYLEIKINTREMFCAFI